MIAVKTAPSRAHESGPGPLDEEDGEIDDAGDDRPLAAAAHGLGLQEDLLVIDEERVLPPPSLSPTVT